MVDVFISYPRAMRARVEPIKARLDALGLSVFFDIEGIDGGDEFPAIIDSKVKAARVVLGCWSPLAFTRPWCMQECRVGRMRGVLVPVALEAFGELDVPTEFIGINYLDLTDWRGGDSHEGWTCTLRALARHVGRDLGDMAAATPRPKDEPSRGDTRLRPGAVWRDVIPGLPHDACPEMVTIPPGRFLMGTPEGQGSVSERPQHEVRIGYTFALGKFPVTFAQWDAADIVGKWVEQYPAHDRGWGRGRRPVIDVTQETAEAYIGWLNQRLGLRHPFPYRLPSEAEWEYACRAGTTTAYSTGNRIRKSQANFGKILSLPGVPPWLGGTQPVGSYPANAFGLHDMHGNVWEWCADGWNDGYRGAPTDGSVWGGRFPFAGASRRRLE